MEGEIKLAQNDRMDSLLKLRKEKLEAKIWNKRVPIPSSQDLYHHDIVEVKEELGKPDEGFLPLNQCNRRHYHRRRKKGKRCWLCGSWKHLKRNCNKLRCYYCGNQGHIKKKCYKYQLNIAIQMLKRASLGEKQEKIKQKNSKYETAYDRMKQVVFREENGKHILQHNGIDLGEYFGDLPFQQARRGFDPPRHPKWKMNKEIYEDIQLSRLKLSDYLPHQCGKDGEVLNGFSFLHHCMMEHRNFVPSGSLINASPYRFWIFWYSEVNFLKFMDTKGKPTYIKADPPW